MCVNMCGLWVCASDAELEEGRKLVSTLIKEGGGSRKDTLGEAKRYSLSTMMRLSELTAVPNMLLA